MATSRRLTGTKSNRLTSSAEASPAKTFPSRETAPDSTEPDRDSGLSLPEPFAIYDPASSLWKTSQACLLSGWAPFSGTWRASGTMRNGKCYPQPMSAPPTFGNESGLWPTPTRSDATGGPGRSPNRTGGDNLRTAVATIPTPTVSRNYNRKGASPTSGDGLATWVRMYPTPTVQDSANNGGPSQLLRDTPPLNAVIGGPLNPRWVEWLMGYPIGWLNLPDSATPSSPPAPITSFNVSDGEP